jgi:cysteinyl-tRNA synthetase
LFLLSKRYRRPMTFSRQKMESPLKNMARICRFFSRKDVSAAISAGRVNGCGPLWKRFCSAMQDDFNFPMALSIVFEGIRTIQRSIGADTGGSRTKMHQTAIWDLNFICQEVLGIRY